MRITWRREPHETGPARVAQAPRGWILKIDGEDVGYVAPKLGGWSRTVVGWYFYGRSDKLQIPSVNTSSEPRATPEEAKAAFRAYVDECLKARTEVRS